MCFFICTGDHRELTVLTHPFPTRRTSDLQLVGIDAVAPSHHRNALPWLKTLANHGQFLLWAPAAPPLLAQKLPTLIVAISHKHNRLPIPYRKGETVSCLSWGRSEEHTSELQSLMRTSYAVFCLKKKTYTKKNHINTTS